MGWAVRLSSQVKQASCLEYLRDCECCEITAKDVFVC